MRKWKQGRSREESTWTSWRLLHQPLQKLQRSPRPAGQAGGAREEHSWEAGMGSWQHFPARPCHDRQCGDVPSVLRPPAPHSCSFESLAWEAVDASLCSLFRPLSSHWRQPCSSFGRLINSIINAEGKESPRSFLIATHTREYKLQADRKQGLVPGDAPLPATGALYLPMPSWTTWPHLPGPPLRAREGRIREEMVYSKPVWSYPCLADKSAPSNECKLSLWGETLEPQPSDGLRTQQSCAYHLHGEKK